MTGTVQQLIATCNERLCGSACRIARDDWLVAGWAMDGGYFTPLVTAHVGSLRAARRWLSDEALALQIAEIKA